MSVLLEANPQEALVDDPVHITVTGLQPWQLVTFATVLVDDGKQFFSHSQYVSDGDGNLDLNRSASHGGTYQGIEPMGLLWSMKQAPGQRPGLRLLKRDAKEPFAIEVFLISGHHLFRSKEDVMSSGAAVVAKIGLKRYYQAKDVLNFPVRSGRVRGMLFLPQGDGPFPGVIDMFGGAGGLIAFRAALLASRGFASLALPFFRYEDLPPEIELNLEYFEEAVDWLHAHPLVIKSGVGVVGVSKGAEIAMHVAAVNSKVKAVVGINSPCIYHRGVHYYHGVEQPVFNDSKLDAYNTAEGLINGTNFNLREESKKCFIPVEKASSANFLFVQSEDDPSLHPSHLKAIVSRLKEHNLSNYQVLSYPGAGHLLEPPYTPLCRVAYLNFLGEPVVYGGETRSHARAQEDSWLRIQEFLWQQLDPGGCARQRRQMDRSSSSGRRAIVSSRL